MLPSWVFFGRAYNYLWFAHAWLTAMGYVSGNLATLSDSDRFHSVSAALGISWMRYWLDLHFVKRGKETGMVEMEGGRNYHLSDTACSFCWSDSNIQDIHQVFHAAQNSLLNDELKGAQELFYELFTENISFNVCFHLSINSCVNLI